MVERLDSASGSSLGQGVNEKTVPHPKPDEHEGLPPNCVAPYRFPSAPNASSPYGTYPSPPWRNVWSTVSFHKPPDRVSTYATPHPEPVQPLPVPQLCVVP